MAIVGFNFTNISAEKTGNVTGKININNNVMLTDVTEVNVNLGAQEDKGLLIKFKYTCEYQPNIGELTFDGDVISLEKAEIVKEAVESWKKDKKIQDDLTRHVLSYILNKSTIQAIVLSRDLSLPAPIPLPKISSDEKASEKAAEKVTEKKK
jgi:hypothetical protein